LSFLANCSQSIVLPGGVSLFLNVSSGVHQVYILGPLLFGDMFANNTTVVLNYVLTTLKLNSKNQRPKFISL